MFDKDAEIKIAFVHTNIVFTNSEKYLIRSVSFTRAIEKFKCKFNPIPIKIPRESFSHLEIDLQKQGQQNKQPC